MSHFEGLDNEAERFAHDVDRLWSEQAVDEPGSDEYQADLSLAGLLSRAQFAPDPRFKSTLWNRLVARSSGERKGGNVMSPVGVLRSLVRPVLVVGLSALLVFGLVLAVSPAVRAAAQEWLTRFVEVDSPWALLSGAPDKETSDQAPGASEPSLPGTGEVPPAGIASPPLVGGSAPGLDQALVSVEEAQAETPLTIKVPASLPDGYSLKGVVKPVPLPQLDVPLPADSPAPPSPASVMLVFENRAGETMLLSEATMPVPAEGDLPLPAGKGSVQEVSVNGQPGQYVEGAWTPQGWETGAAQRMLHWQGTDGVTYDLISQNLGLKDLLAVAESIR
jgi:hypothetical protein